MISVGVVIIGVTVGLHSITQSDIRALSANVAGTGERIAALEPKVDSIDQRLGRVETDLDTVAVALSRGANPTSYVVDKPLRPETAEGADTMASAEPTEIAEAAVAVAEADIEPAPTTAYILVKEKDSSFGNVRRRVTVEIEIPGATPYSQTAILTMMQEAIRRHEMDQPDAISVRLWRSYKDDSNAQNRLVYAPDGCGWAGTDCTGELWRDLMHGELPAAAN